MLSTNKKVGVCIQANTENSEHEDRFKSMGFESENEEKVIDWGECTSFFHGTKEDYIQCVGSKTDIEKMVGLGFVASVERLKDVKSKNAGNKSTANTKPRNKSN